MLKKNFCKLVIGGNFLNFIKGSCEKPTGNSILNKEIVACFPLKIGHKARIYDLSTLIQCTGSVSQCS